MFKASGQVQFDKLLEKATSNLLLEPEWSSIMMICDLIRQKDCPTKYAMLAIKKKLHHQNPHVAMFGLQVLESVVKNCGGPVHDEVATKQFMEELREIAKTTHHENVKEKILELILTWAHAFRKIPSYRAVQDVLNIMKAEGMAFKPLVESDAMFVADTAPEWADGECCHRCRTEFGLVVRKHHCRACGQIFCSKCSSKMCTLPKFGIEKEVRVCDSCFEKYGKAPKKTKKSKKSSGENDTLSEDQIFQQVLAASLAESQAKTQQQPTGPRAKTEEELAEEEQLQLALAISQSEAEAKEMEARKRGTMSNIGGSQAYSFPQETPSSSNDRGNDKSPHKSAESDDPELARYLNRNYWESKAKDDTAKQETGTSVNKSTSFTDKSTAGNSSKNSNAAGGWNSNAYSFMPSAPFNENKDKGEQAEEIDTFVGNLRDQIEIFVNRMKSNSSRGRPIAYDTSVQGLFMNITALHSQLLNFIQIQDNSRTYYEGLQDKLGQIRDARAALDDLRQEHSERLRRQAEEQERVKQYQMAQKLHIMRQKKQEYLQYQRQLAMQRMQEQEREMQMRIEQQQKQQIPTSYGGYQQPPPGMPGYMPQGPPDMGYMQQQHGPPPPHGQFGPPPNVSMGQQMPMNTSMGQYMPQTQQHVPGGQYMPQQQGPPTGHPPGMNNPGPPQQQQQIPHQHNPNPQQQQQMPPPQQQQQQQQQQPNPMQHQQPQQHPQNYPPQDQQPPPLKNEPSTAELISFD